MKYILTERRNLDVIFSRRVYKFHLDEMRFHINQLACSLLILILNSILKWGLSLALQMKIRNYRTSFSNRFLSLFLYCKIFCFIFIQNKSHAGFTLFPPQNLFKFRFLFILSIWYIRLLSECCCRILQRQNIFRNFWQQKHLKKIISAKQ